VENAAVTLGQTRCLNLEMLDFRTDALLSSQLSITFYTF